MGRTVTTWKEIRTKQNRCGPQKTQTPTPISNWNSCTASQPYLLWNVRKTISEDNVVEETVLCPAWYKFFIISFNLRTTEWVTTILSSFHRWRNQSFKRPSNLPQIIASKHWSWHSKHSHWCLLDPRHLSLKHPMLTPQGPTPPGRKENKEINSMIQKWDLKRMACSI